MTPNLAATRLVGGRRDPQEERSGPALEESAEMMLGGCTMANQLPWPNPPILLHWLRDESERIWGHSSKTEPKGPNSPPPSSLRTRCVGREISSCPSCLPAIAPPGHPKPSWVSNRLQSQGLHPAGGDPSGCSSPAAVKAKLPPPSSGGLLVRSGGATRWFWGIRDADGVGHSWGSSTLGGTCQAVTAHPPHPPPSQCWRGQWESPNPVLPPQNHCSPSGRFCQSRARPPGPAVGQRQLHRSPLVLMHK